MSLGILKVAVQTIELDCAPGTSRPDSYIKGVIKDLALPEREPVSKLFGNWTWDYSDIDAELWNAIKPILANRITKLFNEGYIRYGSW